MAHLAADAYCAHRAAGRRGRGCASSPCLHVLDYRKTGKRAFASASLPAEFFRSRSRSYTGCFSSNNDNDNNDEDDDDDSDDGDGDGDEDDDDEYDSDDVDDDREARVLSGGTAPESLKAVMRFPSLPALPLHNLSPPQLPLADPSLMSPKTKQSRNIRSFAEKLQEKESRAYRRKGTRKVAADENKEENEQPQQVHQRKQLEAEDEADSREFCQRRVLRFAVADTGCGVEETEQQKIFRPCVNNYYHFSLLLNQ